MAIRQRRGHNRWTEPQEFAASGVAVDVPAGQVQIGTVRLKVSSDMFRVRNSDDTNYVNLNAQRITAFANLQTGDNVKLTNGGSIKTTSNGDITIEPDGTGELVYGDLTVAGTEPFRIKGDDDGDDDPGVLCLYDHAGTPYYLWVDQTGDLRIHTAMPSDEDADGTVVGAQS